MRRTSPAMPKNQVWPPRPACQQPLSAFGSYTAVPIKPGVRHLNLATGLRPAFITLFTQWVHCFSGLTPEPAWHLAKLPTNYLLTFWNPVCKLCTLRRGEPSRPRLSPLILPQPPPSWHRRWVRFQVLTVNASKIRKARL